MENFETLRKEWNSLEAESGGAGGSSGLTRPRAEAFQGLQIGKIESESGTQFYLYPYGGENKSLTMRELLELMAPDKIALNVDQEAAGFICTSDLFYYTKGDGTWELWVQGKYPMGGHASGTTLDDEIEGPWEEMDS